MSNSKLFEPLQVGRTKLQHRVVMAPLTRLRADDSHVPLPMAVEYYSQRASVPGTLIIAEATQISAVMGGVLAGTAIWSDAHIAGWKKVTSAVHAKGSYIFCQLIALGRAAVPDILKQEGPFDLVAPSALPMEEGAPSPREITEAEIQSSIQDFANAARNAIKAGFDGVEIHGANGYLVDQFIQDVSNHRRDRWGGSIENRARYGIEVSRAIVDAIGSDRVGFRISPWNTWQGMKMQEPIPQFSYLLEELKRLSLAYLHVIESRVVNNVDCEKKEGIEFALNIWGKTSPVLVAGGYTPENSLSAIDDEYVQNDVLIVFGRSFLANPDLPHRIQYKLPLNKYDRASFYTPQQSEGYLDYPFSDDFVAANVSAE
ncbi:hypothetical protein N7456_002381 [Penicillium angulare]|uniref:chanoclavine-I aldehyde reductase n=1 Tax=Penicillium angulare TaxID=116970 RepID=A0A9W9G8A8_9EURO|nr:hypothetical protein N7456_002381 [Penicillium angulare]